MATSLVNFFMTLWISHDVTEPLSDYQAFAALVALLGLLSVPMEAVLRGHPHHQVFGNPACAGHFLQHLLLHGHNVGQPKLLALHHLPQNPPVIFAD